MTTHVDFSGPYFDDAEYDRLITQLGFDIEHDVAQQAMSDWHLNLETSLRFPTGFYESHVQMQTSPSASGGTIVSDQGIIYGHWLEGTGSRNSPRTRFPGYFAARRATQEVGAKVEETSIKAMERFSEKVNA